MSVNNIPSRMAGVLGHLALFGVLLLSLTGLANALPPLPPNASLRIFTPLPSSSCKSSSNIARSFISLPQNRRLTAPACSNHFLQEKPP